MNSFIRRTLTATAVAALFASLPMIHAEAASRCGDRAKMIEFLAKRYKETPRAMGMVSTSGVLELFVSDKGTWTMLMTMASGRTCLMAAGESWEHLKSTLTGPAA